jgi:hypothetical protein
MGHYSLWTVFNALELAGPTSIEPMLSHQCALKDGVSGRIRNDFSFPAASIVRLKYPARGSRPAVDLIWYEGGMKPPVPDGVDELPAEAMMFVGDKGKILAGFHVENPRLLSARKPPAEEPRRQRSQREPGQLSAGLKQWVEACRGGRQSPGSFLNAWPISEAVNLYAAALRTGRKLMYDAESRKITNVSEANRYLSREYRPGWAPESL